jgi:membrane protein implicated in regulation of membrane protease activity
MSSDKAQKLWTVNVIAFILLAVLFLTGMVNWLLLPRGYQAAGALLSLRHFLHDIHAWAAILFTISMLVHWSLHWSYIQNNLKRYKRQ